MGGGTLTAPSVMAHDGDGRDALELMAKCVDGDREFARLVLDNRGDEAVTVTPVGAPIRPKHGAKEGYPEPDFETSVQVNWQNEVGDVDCTLDPGAGCFTGTRGEDSFAVTALDENDITFFGDVDDLAARALANDGRNEFVLRWSTGEPGAADAFIEIDASFRLTDELADEAFGGFPLHVHAGALDVNGPVDIPIPTPSEEDREVLTDLPGDRQLIEFNIDERLDEDDLAEHFAMDDTPDSLAEALGAIEAEADAADEGEVLDFYVNVHTIEAANLGGELRGHLRAANELTDETADFDGALSELPAIYERVDTTEATPGGIDASTALELGFDTDVTVVNEQYLEPEDFTVLDADTAEEVAVEAAVEADDAVVLDLDPNQAEGVTEFEAIIEDRGAEKLTAVDDARADTLIESVRVRATDTRLTEIEPKSELKRLFGLTTDSAIVMVDEGATGPEDVSEPVNVEGLDDGDMLVGLDARPSTGQLFGATDSSRIVAITTEDDDGEVTFEATYQGPSFADEFDYGRPPQAFDFNPTVDLLRLFADGRNNARADPEDGSLVAVDGDVGYLSDEPEDPEAVATAYTNSAGMPEETTQFAIDANNDVALAALDEPNEGTLEDPMQITFDGEGLELAADTPVGFDIISDGKGEELATNTAFVALVAEDYDDSTVHTLDLNDATIGEGVTVGRRLADITSLIPDTENDVDNEDDGRITVESDDSVTFEAELDDSGRTTVTLCVDGDVVAEATADADELPTCEEKYPEGY